MASVKRTTRRLAPVWTEGVSVIIPVQNDSERLPQFFQNLHRCEVLEVLVCDCGSTDSSCAMARDAGAHVFRATSDLATALNGAAQAARGSTLWFLPPVALPPKFAAPYILDIMSLPDYAGGYYTMTPARLSLRAWWTTWTGNLGAWLLRRVQLNNGPFISHGTFQHLGGFKNMPHAINDLMIRVRDDHPLYVMPDPLRLRY